MRALQAFLLPLCFSMSVLSQDPAKAPAPARPNAADVYTRAGEAWQEVEKSYEDRQEQPPGFDPEEGFGAELLKDPWRARVARCSEAMSLLAQAARIVDCEFARSTELFGSHSPDSFSLIPVVHSSVVRGYQFANEGKWDAACFDLQTVLLVSGHHFKVDSCSSALFATHFEQCAMRWIEALVDKKAPPAAVVRMQDLLRAHLAARPDRRFVAKAIRAETTWLLEQHLVWLATEDGKRSGWPQRAIAKLLKDPAPVRERLLKLADAWSAPFELGPEVSDAKLVEIATEVAEKQSDELSAKKTGVVAELLSDPDEDLFRAMAQRCMPSISLLARSLADSRAAIDSARRKLAPAGEIKPTPGAEKGR